MIVVDDITADYEGTIVVHDVSLTVADGSVLGLLGPNGSGKSTLLRVIAGLHKPSSGIISIGGDDIAGLDRRTLAHRLALVGQQEATEIEYTVFETALMGRLPHQRWNRRATEHDLEMTWSALGRVGMQRFAERPMTQLSGGERQRALIARAIVQDTTHIVLDEPTNHLDIAYQLDVLALVRELGVTAVIALHDLNLAATWCDRIALLSSGHLVAEGPPDAVLRTDLIDEVYRVTAHQVDHPTTAMLQLLFTRRERRHIESPAPDTT